MVHLLLILSVSVLCSLPLVLGGYLVAKELIILLFECVVGKMLSYVLRCIFYPLGVYSCMLGLLSLIASISGPSIFTLLYVFSFWEVYISLQYFVHFYFCTPNSQLLIITGRGCGEQLGK